jgi:hypothetical protein
MHNGHSSNFQGCAFLGSPKRHRQPHARTLLGHPQTSKKLLKLFNKTNTNQQHAQGTCSNIPGACFFWDCQSAVGSHPDDHRRSQTHLLGDPEAGHDDVPRNQRMLMNKNKWALRKDAKFWKIHEIRRAPEACACETFLGHRSPISLLYPESFQLELNPLLPSISHLLQSSRNVSYRGSNLPRQAATGWHRLLNILLPELLKALENHRNLCKSIWIYDNPWKSIEII